MKVFPIHGSETLFDVSSDSVQCARCARRFDGARRKLVLSDGDKCPVCSGTLKRVLPYRVDTGALFPIGECACRGFQIAHKRGEQSKRQRAEAMTLRERAHLPRAEQDALRCKHLVEARCFDYNRRLWHRELKQMSPAQRERIGP